MFSSMWGDNPSSLSVLTEARPPTKRGRGQHQPMLVFHLSSLLTHPRLSPSYFFLLLSPFRKAYFDAPSVPRGVDGAAKRLCCSICFSRDLRRVKLNPSGLVFSSLSPSNSFVGGERLLHWGGGGMKGGGMKRGRDTPYT
jgi:hypothetical protein